MKKYQYQITIETGSEADADQKIKSLTVLAAKLNAKELSKLAQVISNDPVKTALAKKYLGV